MKQILQDLKHGKTGISDVPIPECTKGSLLIRTVSSLISPGTEKMLIDFGRANYLEKARQQPEKVKMVLDKIRTDGLLPTLDAIQSKLDHPLALGYSNTGVIETSSADGFKKGERVLSNGPHAEYVQVPANLCAKIPDNVPDEQAVFGVLGAVALQGIRLAAPDLGETFGVIGLGLIGLLTVQLLTANGCSVIGIDLDPEKCSLAEAFGAKTVNLNRGEDPELVARQMSRHNGIDGVLITASSKSNQPVQTAARMCRKRGRIVLVGVTGLALNRSDFYEKELSFQVSCSYGPGRYDPEYEKKGHDYPFGFVRWTEQRNFEAVLNLMSQGRLNVKPLISHRFDLPDALRAYDIISKGSEPYLGMLINYPAKNMDMVSAKKHQRIKIPEIDVKSLKRKNGSASVIGAGNYTGQVFLPALKKTGIHLKSIASEKGVSSTHLGKKFGFEESTTDISGILQDPDNEMVFITTRHDSHFRIVKDALDANLHVFVEKPLCLTLEELTAIETCFQCVKNQVLMIGFNRRFAPLVIRIKELISTIDAPKSMIMTVNAGAVSSDHWIQDRQVGGGRIIGEACHFIDLLRFLTGFPVETYTITTLADNKNGDCASIQLVFSDGSTGTIHYLANGDKRFPKERLEVFCAGKVLAMDNFKTLKGFGWKGFKTIRSWRQDKGHANAVQAFVNACREPDGNLPIPFDHMVEATKISIELANSQVL